MIVVHSAAIETWRNKAFMYAILTNMGFLENFEIFTGKFCNIHLWWGIFLKKVAG